MRNVLTCSVLLFTLFIPLINSSNDENVNRRNKVREMMIHAWNNYKLYAWGANELSPKMKRMNIRSVFGTSNIGATIVDALDTLYIMGLKDEYLEGRSWIENHFTLDVARENLSVFEINIRYVGGFLSLYALTGDVLYKEKAKYVADKLLPAFNSPTGIPFPNINFKNGVTHGNQSMLSEFGTLYMEFAYLSEITDDDTYKSVVERIYETLEHIHDKNEPYPTRVNPVTGKWDLWRFSIGAYGDSFYEYLLKAWIQSGYKNNKFRDKFLLAMKNVVKKLVYKTVHGYYFIGTFVDDHVTRMMEHLTCFTGGMFALAANTSIDRNLVDKYMKLGKEITRTCHHSYASTRTRLGPETFCISHQGEIMASTTRYYVLRPETVESYFYMWRTTHDQTYREWGWDVVNALERHCRTPTGFCGVIDVDSRVTIHDDAQQSFFLAETLKYLFLLFSDDTVLPLDKWVFNTEAHPLPIMKEHHHLKCIYPNFLTIQ